MNFPTEFEEILKRIEQIDPIEYGKSRNYLDGAVTYLSPYISRGVISTRFVYEKVGFKYDLENPLCEQFVKELLWRDYFQILAKKNPERVFSNFNFLQRGAQNQGIPRSFLEKNFGIEVLDKAISELEQNGYLHNHLRMYLASWTCNILKFHWKTPSLWMYSQLLDADYASNSFSWQWVAGTLNDKKYFFNQENANKFTKTTQNGTLIDVAYPDLENIKVPEYLTKSVDFEVPFPLEKTQIPSLNEQIATCIYTIYNLDPSWRNDEQLNRILLIDPEDFEVFPMGKKTLEFCISLSTNISNCQLFIGSKQALFSTYPSMEFIQKEHPLFQIDGIQTDERDWIYGDVSNQLNSFFSYWKACSKKKK